MSPSHAMEAENFPDISHMSPPVTIRRTHEEDNKGLVHRAASWRSQDSSSSEESSADKADSAICDQYLVIIRKAYRGDSDSINGFKGCLVGLPFKARRNVVRFFHDRALNARVSPLDLAVTIENFINYGDNADTSSSGFTEDSD